MTTPLPLKLPIARLSSRRYEAPSLYLVSLGDRTAGLPVGQFLCNSGYLPGETSYLFEVFDNIRSQAETYYIFLLRKLQLSKKAVPGGFRQLLNRLLSIQHPCRLTSLGSSDAGNRLFEIPDNGVGEFRCTVVPELCQIDPFSEPPMTQRG